MKHVIIALSAVLAFGAVACQSVREERPYDGPGLKCRVDPPRDGRFSVHIHNDTSLATIIQRVKLKLNFLGKQGECLATEFFYMTDMNLQPGEAGEYIFKVPNHIKTDVDDIRVEGTWVWES